MADEDMHTRSHTTTHNSIALLFSFFWVINAGSLSKGDKMNHYKK